MEVQLQLILTVCIVNFGSTAVLQDNQKVNQLHNFFDSIAKNDSEKSEMYRESLKDNHAKEKHAFDAMKKELNLTRIRNFYKKRSFPEESNINASIVATDERETKPYKHADARYDSDEYYDLFIPDVSDTEAMNKYKELWIKQLDYLESLKLAAEDVANVTGHEMMTFEFIPTKLRIDEEIKVLSNEPWDNDDEMLKMVRDNVVIYEQNSSWMWLNYILDEHYKNREKDKQEKHFREILNAAREDLFQRVAEIESILKRRGKGRGKDHSYILPRAPRA